MDTVYLSSIKKKASEEDALIIYGDEASFRQSPTLHQTWAPKNTQPKISTTGQRNTQKILGAIAIPSGKFEYRIQEEYFNHKTYVQFLGDIVIPHFYRKGHRIFLIQDNASYHKKPETYEWFAANRKYIEVFNLPKYQPELNAIERIWHHTRMKATHNRFHETVASLQYALFDTFTNIQDNPQSIVNYLRPFF